MLQHLEKVHPREDAYNTFPYVDDNVCLATKFPIMHYYRRCYALDLGCRGQTHHNQILRYQAGSRIFYEATRKKLVLKL